MTINNYLSSPLIIFLTPSIAPSTASFASSATSLTLETVIYFILYQKKTDFSLKSYAKCAIIQLN